MKNTQKNPLWVELTAEETSLVKGGSWGYNKGGGSGGGKGKTFSLTPEQVRAMKDAGMWDYLLERESISGFLWKKGAQVCHCRSFYRATFSGSKRITD